MINQKGPKDLNEFLECLKIDVDHIRKCRAEYDKTRFSLSATFKQYGAWIMAESEAKEELVIFIGKYIDQYINPCTHNDKADDKEARFALWQFFSEEHDLTLLEGQLDKIIHEVERYQRIRV